MAVPPFTLTVALVFVGVFVQRDVVPAGITPQVEMGDAGGSLISEADRFGYQRDQALQSVAG